VNKKLVLAALGTMLLCANAFAQDAKTVIANAQKALGNPKAVTYSGSARDVAFQQCGGNATEMICHGTHDPMRPITSYTRLIDLSAPLSRHTGSTQNFGAGGNTTPAVGTFFQQVTAEQADVSKPWAQSLELYITPWGFLKGAAENNATAKSGKIGNKSYTVVTWSPKVQAPSGKSYVVNGYVSDANIVERVETWLGENIMGDMAIVANYSDWRDFDGFMFPTEIKQSRGGWPFFEVDVSSAAGNPADERPLAPPPPNRPGAPGGPPAGPPPGGGQPPALNVTSEKLGDGLYRLTTGTNSYDSVLVEFKSYVMMLEAGQSIARATAYIAETKKLFPGKPIRYVMNTHPHSDHTGGLPALVAEGATLITQTNNKDFFERALNTPRTLLDDVLAKNPKKLKIETVDEKRVYTDGTRTVEMYHIYPAPHSNGLLVAYIPKERVLFQGDFSVNPGETANDHVKALVPALEKLGLVNFDRYINVHASAAPQHKEDVWKAMGR
jgi:glyoxylase-like metal-dependent hydrolase (beta-lactamase superfamily II)